MDDMTFEDYIVSVSKRIVRNMSTERIGQAYMNELGLVRPDLHERIIDTIYDPFYVDHRLPEFLAEVSENWDE